ncbi:hypothetical protein ACTFIV_000224 [Dictyostelium citrinum]
MKLLLAVIVLLLSICFSNSTFVSFMGSYTDSTCEDSQPGLSYYAVNDTCNSGLSSFLGTTPSNFGTKDGNSWSFELFSYISNSYGAVKKYKDIAGGCESFSIEIDTFGFDGQCTLSPGFAKLETPYYTRVYEQYSLIYPNDAIIVELYDTSLSNQCKRYQNFMWSAAIDNGFKYQSNDGSNIYQYSCNNGIPTVNICDTKGNCSGENLSTNCVNGVNVFCPQ